MWQSLVLTFLLFIRFKLGTSVTIYPMQCHTVTCDNTPTLSANISCTLRQENPGLSYITLSGSLLHETNDFLFSFQALLKKNRVYVPNMITGNADICEFTRGTSNMLFDRLFPKAKEDLKNVLMECPYKGYLELKDYELTGDVVSKFMSSGYYRFDTLIKNSQNGVYLGVKLYCIINKRLVRDPKP